MTTINHLKQTHTFVVMELPKPMTDYIANKFREAGYHHVFNECDGKIVMDCNGIAIGTEDEPVESGVGGSPFSRSSFSHFDDLTSQEFPIKETLIPGIPDIVKAAHIDGSLDALTEGVQELFDEHPKKQPEVSGYSAVITDEQATQLEENSDWVPAEGLQFDDIQKNLVSLEYQTVFCQTCNKNSDILIPLTDKGKQVQHEGTTYGGETLGENERFALCGTDPERGGIGLVYKVKFVGPEAVTHVSGLLT